MKNWQETEEESYIKEVNSLGQKEIEDFKWNLLQELCDEPKNHFKAQCDDSLSLIIANKNVRLFFPKDSNQIELDFLFNYLEAFLGDHNDENRVSIYYLPFQGELADPNHKIWWEKSYYTRTKILTNNSFLLSQRNFIGQIYQDKSECFIRGPKLIEGVIDTIDNFFLSCVAPALISVNSIALHAATVIYDNKAYVFYGPSGVGKSTLAEFCYEKYGFKVMSGDQIYLNVDTKGDLWAWPCVSTIYNFERGHDAWASKPHPVQSLCRLERSEEQFTFFRQTPQSLIMSFMREVVYLPEFGKQSILLDFILNLLKNNTSKLASMSYNKDYDFWNDFQFALKENNEQ